MALVILLPPNWRIIKNWKIYGAVARFPGKLSITNVEMPMGITVPNAEIFCKPVEFSS